MPHKPLKPCSYPGCPELTSNRYCIKHQKQIDSNYNKFNRPFKKLYESSRWRRLRWEFLKEHPLCNECKKVGIVNPAEVVDHIIPHKGNVKLFWNQNNFQSLCKSCHDKKTAKEDGRWGKQGIVYSYKNT